MHPSFKQTKSYKEKKFYKIANHQSKLLDIIINIHILNHLYLENCSTHDSWGTINLSPSGLNKDSNYEIINFAPHWLIRNIVHTINSSFFFCMASTSGTHGKITHWVRRRRLPWLAHRGSSVARWTSPSLSFSPVPRRCTRHPPVTEISIFTNLHGEGSHF